MTTVKTTFYKVIAIATLAFAFHSCKPGVEVPTPQKGTLDVSKYVAIGNSIGAGYADNALYYNGQLVSYPNLIANQFKLIEGGAFKQPLVPAASVGVGSAGNARYVLAPVTDCAGATSLSPKFVAPAGDMNIFINSVAADGPFNNMSVPGAKATTVLYSGYGNYLLGPGNYNPFYTRMSANPTTASILGEAMAQTPTFFSLFIGTDDAMGYALSGGTADAITPSAGPAGFGFDASIDAIAGTLISGGAKGVIANIANINKMPYFTTIPSYGLVLDATTAAQLTAAYSALDFSFQAGPNPFVIEDASAPGGMRQIKATEFVLLSCPQDSLKCAGWGSMKPIPNQYTLSEDEIDAVNDAIDAYNVKLQATATALGLAFVDVNAFVNRAKTGIKFNGLTMKAEFVTGGIYSLDGVHFTPIGNALLANEFIKAINAKYGSTIPRIDATSYPGVAFP